MSFPWHDGAWVEVGDLLEASMRPGERVLAPDLFWWRTGRVERYVRANFAIPPPYEWVVLHRDDTAALPRPFADALIASLRPVLANAVFVVLTSRDDVPRLEDGSPGVVQLVAQVRQLPIAPTAPPRYEADRVLRDNPTLVDFATMTRAELRRAYDDFFDDGGYGYPTARDQAYFEDVHEWHRRLAVSWRGRRVLELCSATTSYVDRDAHGLVVRTDLSPSAIEHARRADRDAGRLDTFRYAVVDAEALAFADDSFGAVSFVDAIEHVTDAAQVLREVGRVLAPGGEVLLTFSNRDSLNYVLNRALGHPEFGTNHQHIAEFTYGEITHMLDAAGLDVAETGGVELRPFLGVPGVDEHVRTVTDDDPVVVATLRELGRRAGVEYAYVGVVLARAR
jgi:SAM-dependent methyltransferase